MPCPYASVAFFFQNGITQQKTQKNNFGGGLGDATVTQSGVWWRIPQVCWLF